MSSVHKNGLLDIHVQHTSCVFVCECVYVFVREYVSLHVRTCGYTCKHVCVMSMRIYIYIYTYYSGKHLKFEKVG